SCAKHSVKPCSRARPAASVSTSAANPDGSGTSPGSGSAAVLSCSSPANSVKPEQGAPLLDHGGGHRHPGAGRVDVELPEPPVARLILQMLVGDRGQNAPAGPSVRGRTSCCRAASSRSFTVPASSTTGPPSPLALPRRGDSALPVDPSTIMDRCADTSPTPGAAGLARPPFVGRIGYNGDHRDKTEGASDDGCR